MRFIDLFCGIGGFHHALSELGHECVFACDIDEKCREIYQENWEMTVFDDIRNWVDQVDPHEFLCAGFPCQPFSKSGKQEGFEDQLRGTLFGELMKIVSNNQPDFILLENVANMRTHDNGNTFKTIRSALQREGYFVRDKILSPDQFGVPHHRPRLFIVAIKKNTIDNHKKFRFPKPDEDRKASCHVDLIYDIHSRGEIPNNLEEALRHWNILLNRLPKNVKPPSPTWSMEFGRSYDLEDIHPIRDLTKSKLSEILKAEGIIVRKSWTKEKILMQFPPYIRKMKAKMPKWKKRFIENNRAFWNQYGNNIADDWLIAARRLSETHQKFEWHVGKSKSKDVFDYMIHSRPSGIRISKMNRIPALVAMAQTPIIGPWGRKISPREAANAQSFRADFVLHEDDSVAFKQLGNSVNVAVVKAIVEEMTKLKDEKKAVFLRRTETLS